MRENCAHSAGQMALLGVGQFQQNADKDWKELIFENEVLYCINSLFNFKLLFLKYLMWQRWSSRAILKRHTRKLIKVTSLSNIVFIIVFLLL
jgi:hypothetical protein